MLVPLRLAITCRTAALAVIAVIATGAIAGCGSHDAPPPAHPVAAPAPPPPIVVQPARTVLSSYLNATESGAHARAWDLLTKRDQAALTRGGYVNQQQADDRLRAQVKTRYAIASVREVGARADAIVTVTTGLGSEQVRFVLRRDPDHWRIDYRASWQSP